MIEEILIKIGLDKVEVQVYIKLLEAGMSKAGDLARKLNIPRATVYEILSALSEKGVITESLKGSVKVFIPKEPTVLIKIFEEKISELQATKEKFSKILPTLKIHRSKLIAPKLELFEGKEALQNVLKEMLYYYDIETFAYWPIKNMVKVLGGDFFEKLNRTRIKQRIYTKALWPEDQRLDISKHPYLGSGKEFYREIRILPNNITFDLGYWGYGDKVAFLASEAESFGFTIQSKELSQTIKTQFDLAWTMSYKLEHSITKAEKDFLTAI